MAVLNDEQVMLRDMAREWAGRLEQLVGVPVELVDERLTTVTATAALRASGRKGKQARAVIDQAAAVADPLATDEKADGS